MPQACVSNRLQPSLFGVELIHPKEVPTVMTRKVSLTLLWSFWLSLLLPLQGQQSTPPPPPQSDPQDVVRITTNLVQIDVVATKDGKPVTDLQAEDFEILEDGKPRVITNFSYVSNVPISPPAAPATAAKAKDKITPPVPPAKIDLNDQRRTVALVIDDLGISFESMSILRSQVRKFLDTLSPNDLVAIIRTGGDVGSLQQFTNDRRVLQNAFDHLRWNPCSRAGLNVFQPAGALGSNINLCSASVISSTLHSLSFILKGMAHLPGRKSMMFFSDYLPIEDQEPSAYEETLIARGGSQGGGSAQRDLLDTGTTYYQQLQRIAELAIRSSVVIYSVDTRGLRYTGPTAADRIVYPSRDRVQPDTVIGRLSMARSAQLLRGREGSDLIARQSGGFLIRNSNDFGFKDVMSDQQGYYLIGFRPAEDSFDHNFHRIKAKSKRSGLTVRTRAGFYGFTEDEARPPRLAVDDQMKKALISPFGAKDVALRLTTFFVDEAAQGPTLRSFVFIDPHDLTFTEQPEGWHVANLDLHVMIFGDNGRILGEQDQTGTLRFRGDGYERAMREGIAYSFDIPVKLRGSCQFRVAVRDAVSSRIGAAGQFVEIPDLKDGHLALSGIVARLDPRDASDATDKPGLLPDKSIATGPAVRKFPQGSSVKFSYAIYNAGAGGGPSQTTSQVRIFREGKLIFTGDPVPVNFQGQTDLQHLVSAVRFQIDSNITPGDYVLQIIVSDSAKQKPRVATQWIDFEVVK